ncbi:Clp protease N-terminal domain-containing protein [Nocardioides cynanchi]|uniref:Clp protease N-terminal domain-containing protein n=1 Tax=Nocardioides cynanchi TaxID=2558918 RepID=UPI0012469A66|nr:Clp protease N-terminal domain-containing protein [Nocardioides cynanchi]
MSPKINVYLPDELAEQVKVAGIPVSAICQQALADAVAVSSDVDRPPGSGGTGLDLSRSFTKRAYGVLADAEKLAEAAGHEPTTVDLVAALVESGGLAVVVLESADLEPLDLYAELRARADQDPGAAGPLEALAERAVEQARGLGHTYVGTEHLLLGLTAGPTRELARATLKDLGITHESALRGVATALSAYSYARETLTFSGLSAPIRAALEEIRSRLSRLEDRTA